MKRKQKNLYITTEEVTRKLPEDIFNALKPLESAPVHKIRKQAMQMVTAILSKAASKLPIEETVEFTTRIEGNNLIFVALNLTTEALFRGYDITQKRVPDTEEFVFWHFDGGIIRQDKKNRKVVFIPHNIARNVDSAILDTLRDITDQQKGGGELCQ